jgi:TonB family protein
VSVATLRLGGDAGRTRWSMTASVVVHALLLLWLILFRHATEQHDPTLAEIAWLDADPAETPSAAASPAPADAPAVTSPLPALRRAKVSDPGTLTLDDRMSARLEALQHGSTPDPITGPAVTPLPSSPAPAVVGAPGTPSAGPALALRHGAVDRPGLELRRVPGAGASAVPAVVATHLAESSAAAPATAPAGATTRRMLAGAALMGPVSDRAILTQVTPVYPEWAKREAVEASVTLYFVVRSDGSVRENVLVQKTAGFEDFDESARAALRAWRFQALPQGSAGEQWGTITFHFRLRDAG